MGKYMFLEEPWGEVFDPKTQVWERLPDPCTEVRKFRVDNRITEVGGKIYFASLLVLRTNNTYAYDTKQCKWECECDKGLIAKVSKVPSPEYVRVSSAVYISNRYLTYKTYLRCSVYDVEDGDWKDVKGLESLSDKYMMNGGLNDHIVKVVRCGGKLFSIWEGVTTINSYNRKIWCAGIVLEKRDGGEIWGNVEWVDVVHTLPKESQLLHCHAVSV